MSATLWRRRRLPDEIRAHLPLEHRDRILAFTHVTGGWAVASERRLHVVTEDSLSRPWTDVAAARLDPAERELVVSWVDGTRPTVLQLTENTLGFPRAVRQCVESSILLAERVKVGRAHLRVVLRRDADDNLFTQVIGPSDVDLDDPETAAAVDAAEARVREAAGLR